ncbi:Ca2+/H+ antiporter [Scheffersomyces stipitis CBS 6054]|uniref:Ca2+/H+ antiporter n=1 Tax=Scheffersomyces stipitis (strain ATCC 58785 / CBS 6054 / NBRC 10063 / NRRL Y-11545) TaxID=322104 RepID=A3GIB9_PICST|nr:Ca2+/H+ antiporter [Scheffersomyces stipitis CBS 6054]EAZ62963.2 Ca2+/H+ antiporter [Scheffersomyces stipitis CBS 6054]
MTDPVDPNLTRSPRLKPDASVETEFSRNSSIINISSQPTSVRNRSTTKLKRKSRPHLRRAESLSGHQKLVFSVDDDINDAIDEDTNEEDIVRDPIKKERDYLVGYNDALKSLYQRKKHASVAPAAGPGTKSPELIAELESHIAKDLLDARDNIRLLDEERRKSSENILLVDEVDVDEGDDDDGDSVKSSSSSQTVESLNLRERQDAINSTHPFGIKIWKPSLYKKKRSVAARAEEDIHDFDPRKPTARIFWGVTITNYIWSLTFGLLLFLVCLLGAFIAFVVSGFGIHRPSRQYVTLLLKLGKYWLYPFGKFVLLNKDENYLDEDELDGRSISEFHRWRLQEEGRLFFAPPRRYTTGAESRPLLKDHKGRPLRDAYSSLDEHDSNGDADAAPEDPTDSPDIKVRFFGRGSWSSGRLIFYIFFYGILQPVLYIVGLLCWLIVFTIPMANITFIVCDHLRRHPLALDFELEKEYYKKLEKRKKKKNQMIVVSTYRCCGFHYYKYTIDGTNIFFINLLTVVLFVILDYFFLKEKLHWDYWFTDSSFLFCACLFSIIPLAYFIGQAVASISAQSSMGVGAVINAFFSTIVEIFLYCVALNQSKAKLVEGSMIGSILGGVLLLPGLSMCGGALKRKTQRYNPRSAGVSSTMLLFAMVIMFAPSLFYQIYGAYEIKCMRCDIQDDCTKCRFIQPTFTLDVLFYNIIQPFSLIVAIALFLAYVCGLYFTLRTHASLIWATTIHEAGPMKKDDGYFRSPSISSVATPQQLPKLGNINTKLSSLPPSATAISKNGGGHDAPNWSRNKSTIILLGATLLYAIIAEILVDNVDSVLSSYPIDPKFLGLTVFALVPNTTEFLNAISFAISGNVALSMEIGSAYALQVVLIQIPSLVLYSMYMASTDVSQIFTLVFPRWDIIATLISIYLFTYIYAEGKSNYFKGVILILIYAVVMIGFWFNDKIIALDDGYSGGPELFR